MEAEVQLKARKDSVTSQESSDWGEELEDFQPGRLGLSDSPHIVTWRFEDYPQEQQDSRSEQYGLEENTSEKKDSS